MISEYALECENLMAKITENQMANSFEILLNSGEGIKGFPKFKSVFREVTCQQGIADFITITGSDTDSLYNNCFESGLISLDTSSLIISLLKFNSPRTEDFLIKATGLSKNTVRKVLKTLEVKKVVTQSDTGSFTLSPNWGIPSVELWAFELKLSNWKRALFQVLQYKAFANRVVIVLPTEKESIICKNIELFKELRVGVMTFDTLSGNNKVFVKPQKNNPSSKRHNLYALGTISSKLKGDSSF